MEDRHVLAETPYGTLGAVFDGHNGDAVAALAAAQLRPVFEVLRHAEPNNVMGLVRSFERIQAMVTSGTHAGAGACAVAFVVDKATAWVANAGDAELVYVRGGGRAEILTTKHGLGHDREMRRMYDAGALIKKPYFYDPTTGRGLMPTRSLGDREFERVGLLHDPDVRTVNLTSPGWLVAGSNGLWDVVRADELTDLLAPVDAADNAAALLVDTALEVRQSGDNVTVIAMRVS